MVEDKWLDFKSLLAGGLTMRRLFFLIGTIGLIVYLLSYESQTGSWGRSWLKTSQRMVNLIRYENLQDYTPSGGQKIVEINGKLAANLEENQLKWVPLGRIPQHLRFAVIAVEDSRYFQHGPLDLQGIARAVWVNLTNRTYAEGGSTITQQLAKNLFLNQEKTLERKAEEAVLAFLLEKKYSKDQILEMYLNQIYFGPNTYGVGRASEKFFGKSVDKLSLAEAAMLAGIPKNPGKYSPVKNYPEAKERQELVLERMLEAGFITGEEAKRAKTEVIRVGKAMKQVMAEKKGKR